MKAVIALVLASIALSSALTITDPYYQVYEIYYDAALCPLASISSIELYDNYDSSVVGGADINSYCYYGTTCTSYGAGSYERVCVTGEPVNLGVKAIELWSSCDATSVMPFEDTYVSGSGSTTREETSIKTWMPGCHTDDGYYYNFASVNAGGAGCAVFDNGYCGTNSSCVASDCTTTSYNYALATASSGCATGGSTYQYLECAATAFVAPATKDLLFFYDTDRIVFSLGYCGASSTCPSYWLGDGVCDSSCNNANCDYDCDTLGNCDCCVPASVSSCCTPPAYGSTNVCCDVDPTDMELVANNTAWIMVFEACFCDGINTNLGLDNSVSVGVDGLCDLSAATTISFSTIPTTTTLPCDYAKVLSWCHAHALQDSSYTEVLGTDSTTTEWVDAVVSSWTTTVGVTGGSMGAPLPECLSMGGQFTTEYTYTGGDYYTGSVQDICMGIATYFADCDVDCSSASTLALSALFALVF